ncbi:hypothetical protein [Nostoc sp.]|uniref:hypothetical protein n=1 Tax=Nostoc sp. TaxID=1180 RepID=UPI002FFD3EF5
MSLPIRELRLLGNQYLDASAHIEAGIPVFIYQTERDGGLQNPVFFPSETVFNFAESLRFGFQRSRTHSKRSHAAGFTLRYLLAQPAQQPRSVTTAAIRTFQDEFGIIKGLMPILILT